MSATAHPIDDLIRRLGGATKLARRLSNLDPSGKRFPIGTIGAWASRKSIPLRYWGRLLDVAKHFDIDGITERSLVKAHEPPLSTGTPRRPRNVQPSSSAQA